MSGEWISVAEAARRLGVEKHSVYNGIAHAEIPSRRIGRTVRVPRVWVEGTDLSPDNGHTALNVDGLAGDFARLVLAELGRLLGEAARATAQKKSGTVLDRPARDDNEGRHSG